MQQLARLEQPPAGVLVHPLAGDDHRRAGGEIARAHAHRPARARVLEVAGAGGAAGGALEHEQLVHVGVAQGPEVGWGDQHDVQREHRQVLGDPARRADDRAADVAVALDLLGDQREVALGVGLALDQRRGVAELGLDPLRVADHPVVGEQPAALLERVGVLGADRAGRGVADVGDERARGDLARLVRERLVLVGGDRLLEHLRVAVRVERAEPGPVGLAAALLGQRVGRLEQPEGGADRFASAGHAEQPTHRCDLSAGVLLGGRVRSMGIRLGRRSLSN